MTALYDNIKQFCQEKHITLADIEQAADLPRNTISRWGKTTPGIYAVQRVAAVLGTTVDELLRNKGEKQQ